MMLWWRKRKMKAAGMTCSRCRHYKIATGGCVQYKPTRASGRLVERHYRARETYGTDLCEWEGEYGG